MFYTKEELTTLPRKELQKLCKQFSIKANKKNCELVDDLVSYFAELQKEERSLEQEIKSWVSDDEEPSKQDEDNEETIAAKQGDTLKQQLEDELEKRAEEKLTKIPRLRCDKVQQPSNLMSPAVQKLTKSHKRQFDNMDSIDVYLQKKKRRVEEQFNYHNKLKTQAEQSLHKMKASHNTPAQKSDIGRKSSGTTPNRPERRKSFYKSPFKPTTLKVDKEVTFNFVSKLKSPKPVLKEQNVNVAVKKPVVKSKAVSSTSNAKDARKSVQFAGDAEKRKIAAKTSSRLNVTVGDVKSPRFVVSGLNTSAKKTPAKFDLQASLKKRLSYKPHTGKLKDSYTRKSTEPLGNTTMNSTFTIQQKTVKEMTKPKATRNDRRNAATKRRGDKRSEALSKRRGIQC